MLVLAVVSVLARLPFLLRPLSPDEGGFLMVAGHWAIRDGVHARGEAIAARFADAMGAIWGED